ncbi:DNA recombination protein RmuC [Isoptericola sp. NEAU-Y5]|uniref:DNA recombination protein RmuC n=1 Tax=Isoptericola luteus TaxID=2879484 RepID=A0ABS7ZD85_9MICO|nr:DNA recombination protein RmuC [Isoptericola sp. NEAU-Y5]MCA5892422.1 DNA recombination protein RmuC [Isoptericola sp. NEAU-Y5]
MTTALFSLGALAVGVLLGWLWHANRAARGRRSEEVELVRTHGELEAARRDLADLRGRLERAADDGERRAAAEREQAARELARMREDADRRVVEAREQGDRLLSQVRADLERQLAEAKGDQEAAAQRFTALANEVLAKNQTQFLDLANERLQRSTQKHDETLAQREQAIRALLDPMSKTLDKVHARVDTAEQSRLQGHTALTEQLRQLEAVNSQLRVGTSDLVSALRSNQTRGVWGELQLRRVVESAGMMDHVDFEVQAHRTTAEGDVLIPDLVVNLSGGKHVVVDAKVPLSAYLRAQQSAAPGEADKELDAHARDLAKHVDVLAGKAYWSQFDSAPEFVVLFVPAEPILAAAVEHQPDLLETAIRKRVLVATPMTLVAMLRTVAYAWQQDAIAEDAQRVLQTGKELYARIVTMTKSITRLGQSMTTATKHYNAFIGSLETRVLPQARRMVELKVVDAGQAIEPLKAVEDTTRAVTKPELLAVEEGLVVDLGTLSLDGDRDDSVESLVDAAQRDLERADRADRADGKGESAAG